MAGILLKIEKIFFYLLIFCLPFQVRKVIYQWGDYFNEYQSAYLYLTDILLVGIFLLLGLRYCFQKFQIPNSKFQINSQSQITNSKKIEIFLGLFLAWCFLSLFWAENFSLGLYQGVKLLEFALIFLYIKYNLSNVLCGHIFKVFIASALFQSFIAIGQFFKQGSLGLRFLGESVVGLQIPGTANFFADGAKLIRAYGTFPHPNLLAAFLLISLFLIYYFCLRRQAKFEVWTGWGRLVSNLALGISLFLVSLALVLSFSRTGIGLAIFGTILLFIFLFFKRTFRQKYLWETVNLLIVFLTISLCLYLVFEPALLTRAQVSWQEPAVNLRLVYNRMAADLIREHPFGIGLGNYIWHLNSFELWRKYDLFLPYLFQPVHNFYLLIASEIGIIGLIIFLIFLFAILKFAYSQFAAFALNSQIRIIFYCLSLIVLSCLLFAFFDHFFWTLQQGRLMFWVLLGIFTLSKKLRHSSVGGDRI